MSHPTMRLTYPVLLCVVLLFISGCKKEVFDVQSHVNYQPAIPCDSICYDTLSFAKKIAYYPWKLQEIKHLGQDFDYPVVKFYRDEPAGSIYENFNVIGNPFLLPIPAEEIHGYFSASYLPYFKIDTALSGFEEYDLLQIGNWNALKHDDFQFLLFKDSISMQPNPYGYYFAQLQIVASEDLNEAFIYRYSTYSSPQKGSDPPWLNKRSIIGFHFTRDSVPDCQCLDSLINYP